ncbi:MAG: energy-coupling factor transporter transmembrane protein EcfT, partial [Desulfofustis sp.]|nr:energy-coupling factor transporter transmembrane protein EcfT [Desulfofustis sp.]
MNFETFSTSSSFLHRLDARVKLLASLALVMVIALCRTFPTACAGLILALVLLMAARLSLQSVSKRLLLVNGFVLFLWFTLPLTYPGTTAFALGPLALSREGLVLAALITIKTNATVLMLISLVATSSLAALGQALMRLKVPTKLC